jgi:hypothetical protein
MPNQASPLVLEVWRGKQLVHRGQFAEPSVTIGSGPSAMLAVKDASVAELHAVVNLEEDGTILVLDLGGESGVVVNGDRVANAALRPGDSFVLGALTFRVLTGEAAVAEDPTEDQPSAAPNAAMSAAPNHASAHEDAHDDHHGDEKEDIADVVAFVMRSASAGPPANERKKPPILEVHQMWGNVLLESKQFPLGTKSVNVGARSGHRWSFLGVDMGWVPAPLGFVLPYFAPMWSDVNTEWKSDFIVPRDNLPEESDWELFTEGAEEGKYVAHIAQGWDGFADIGGKRHSFEQLASSGRATKTEHGYDVALSEDLRLMIEGGGNVFFAQMASPQNRILARMNDEVDYAFLGMIGFGGFVFLTVAMLMWLAPPDRSNDSNEIPDRFVDLLLEKPDPEKKDKKPSGNPDAGEGAKAKKEEGKVGKKEAKVDKAKGNKIEVKKLEIDREIAEQAGILGAMADSDLNAVMGASGLSSELVGGIGGLIGTAGTQIGSGGLGGRGSGLGGGGTAEGLGGLGTKGMGSGSSGYGKGGGDFGAKGEGGLGAVGGDPIILGALDRSLIDEVIKRHMNQIRYCYQRELTKNAALGGKIVIKFTIAKDGTVSAASTKSTTMNNASTESCIVGRFLRMQFPEPKGGGIVIVSYPFIFSPG